MGIAKISSEAKITLSKITRVAKIPQGLCAKLTAVVILGLCFIIIWSFYSPTPENLTAQRDSFSDISEASLKSPYHFNVTHLPPKHDKVVDTKRNPVKVSKNVTLVVEDVGEKEEDGGVEEEEETEGESEEGVGLEDGVDVEGGESEGGEEGGEEGKERKELGTVFEAKGKYSWKLCSVRSKFNYIPCVDVESVSGSGKVQKYRHLERSCPKSGVMCLVPLPSDGYGSPVRWPESKAKVEMLFLMFLCRVILCGFGGVARIL